MYAEACYYSAELGRFVSADPLFVGEPEECVGSPLECGLYGYADNNPVKYVDPDGLNKSMSCPKMPCSGSQRPGMGGGGFNGGPRTGGGPGISRHQSAPNGSLKNFRPRTDSSTSKAKPPGVSKQGEVGNSNSGTKISRRAPVKAAKLPLKGKVRYIPPKNWKPSQPLPRGPPS